MKQQKNQGESNATLLEGIQNEVSAENAPLLRFITRYASIIAGVVLLFLLVLGGTALWNWHHGNRQEEARQELARISIELKGKDRDAALAKLAENAPDSVKLFIYMSLGQSAQENGDPVLAADAYAKAAKLDGDGPLGLTAALGNVGSLLMRGEYAQGLALLRELDAAGQSPQLKQMLAEAAARAGKTELAIKTYNELAEQVKTPRAAYFRSRAGSLSSSPQKLDVASSSTN